MQIWRRIDNFCTEINYLFVACLEYLDKWMKPMEDFCCFKWMTLDKIPDWNEVESSIQYLISRDVPINDVKCFDQFSNLKCFIKNNKELDKLMAHQKWTKYFENAKNIECYSELLKVAQFFFAVSPHNANLERIFSLMQSQWTKERSKLTVESIRGVLLVQYNFKHMSCKDFYNYLKNNMHLLKEIQSSNKYKWVKEKENKD